MTSARRSSAERGRAGGAARSSQRAHVARAGARQVPRSRYVDGVEILYISTNGSADATKASIPWHFVVNGSIEVGQTARIVLAGDASEIVKADVRAALEGVGVPPLRDLVAKAKANGVPIHV